MTTAGRRRPASSAPALDVAIIGAGPYGLGLAAHLSHLGVEHRIFGRSMQAWSAMSPGMHLKSLGFATSISTPDRFLTLPEYCRAHGDEDYEPIPISTFAEYGITVQRQLVPELEEVNVRRLEHSDTGFVLSLDNGETFRARQVVNAIGLSGFERIPSQFRSLPRHLWAHTAERADFSDLAGLDVTVIGAGQSALQAAALLHEHGAEVRIVAREQVRWSGRGQPEAERSLLERIRVPVTVLGHGRDNWVLEHVPWLMHALPDERRLRFVHTHLGPGGAWWLRDRVEGVIPVHTGTRIVEAVAEGEKVRLTLVGPDGQDDILSEYLVLGTGYDIDVDQLGFVAPALAERIARIERAPRLNRHFETSMPGLYFVGPSSAPSFGPLFRFVAGSAYAIPHVARQLDRRRRGNTRTR